MLSPEHISVIKQTVPVLAEKGDVITQRFYQLLFERHPELKNVFNLANQRNGHQSRALADAIFAYANLIEAPEQLGPMVNRIAHKHVSLNIQPEHYPWVGESLLLALSETLNLPMEHEIIQAWGEAYGVLANIFIQRESRLYQQGLKDDGWMGYRPFTIVGIEQETPLIKSFYLKPADDRGLPLFKSGQYVGVRAELTAHDFEEIRQYSLSDRPGLDHYRITVKAEPGKPQGVVSNHLHDTSRIGDEVQLSIPCGDFTLPNTIERDIVFISGGVGITPLMSMAKDVIQSRGNHTITFIHCAQSSEHACFKSELDEIRQIDQAKCFLAYLDGEDGDHKGYLDQKVLDRFLPTSEVDVYFCGPFPFMVALKQLLLQRGLKESRLHYEVFGPTLKLTA